MALLTITWPILRARNSCGSGGKPRNASIFPSANSSIGLGRGTRDPVDVLGGVKPDIGGHADQKGALARAQVLHAHRLALEVRDAADAFFANSSKHPTCTPAMIVIAFAGIDRDDAAGGEKFSREIDLASRERYSIGLAPGSVAT